MIGDIWQPEWNHLEEFWIIMHDNGTCMRANPYTREWFFMKTGVELVGSEYTPNKTAEFLQMEGDTEVYTGLSSFTGARIEYRLVRHGNLSVVNIKFEQVLMDEELLQRRLEEARTAAPNKKMFPALAEGF